MNKTRAIGIFFAVVFAILAFAVIGSAFSEASKYDGLTEEQIDNVKILYERCETSAYLSGAGSDTAIRRAIEKCEEIQAARIAEYRAQNKSQ